MATTAVRAETLQDAAKLAGHMLRVMAAQAGAAADGRLLARKAGSVVFHVTLLRVSADVPAGAVPACTGSILNFDDSQFLFLTESKTVRATATATGAACTVTVPFEWARAEVSNGIQPDVGIVIPGPSAAVPYVAAAQALPRTAFPANDGAVHLTATFRY